MGQLDVKFFYIRRALRIWPLYFFFLLLVYLVIPQESVYSLKTNYLISMLLFVGNWACVFIGGMGASVAGPLWSISVEEQFYLAWPLIISRVGVKHLKRVCIGLIIFSNLTRIAMEKMGAGFVAFWCSTVTWFDAIAAGALIALLLRETDFRRPLAHRILLGLGGLALWVFALRFRNSFIYPDVVYFPLIVIGSVMMLLAILGSSLKNPALVYLGRISYGLYVFHMASLALTSLLFVKYTVFHAVTSLVITVALSAISYQFVEKPFLRLKKRFTYVASDVVALAESRPAFASEEARSS